MSDITPVMDSEAESSNDLTGAPTQKEEIKKFPLTEQRCLEIGGHCWIEDLSVFATDPPTYIRYCKHCGKRQQGRQQDPMRWHDI